jgi:hypothetical protein
MALPAPNTLWGAGACWEALLGVVVEVPAGENVVVLVLGVAPLGKLPSLGILAEAGTGRLSGELLAAAFAAQALAQM